MQDQENTVGITTTVPIEAIYAAGCVPVDVNNIFIASDVAGEDISLAETRGFPQTFCAWVKGLYGAIHRRGIKRLVGVTAGDCSDTHALLEILSGEGVQIIPFAYPYEPDPEALKIEITRLCERLGTTYDSAEAEKKRLDTVRHEVHALDRMAWEEGTISGAELFQALINSSDFQGNPEAHGEWCRKLMADAGRRNKNNNNRPRLGLAGIPPIFSDLLEVLEGLGAEVIYHELPRQFALPYVGKDLAESYSLYTYPYRGAGRVEDILAQAEKRHLDGIIHYVQSFCHRQIHDRILRERAAIPILTLEGDRPGPLDARSQTRLEAFLETIG